MKVLRKSTFWSETLQSAYTVKIVGLPCAKVELVSAMTDPAETLTKVVQGYSGKYSNLSPTDSEINKAIEDINLTKLKDPLKMMSTIWLISYVTRAFTHQIVRYAVGTAFVQESMRFLGAKGEYYVLATHRITESPFIDRYEKAAYHSIEIYNVLIDDGIPSEDARGILPTNILTQMFFFTSLLGLKDIYAQRMCCQAQQGEWQPVLKQMRDILKETYGEEISNMLQAPYEKGLPCGYRASFDRPCKWTKESP